MKKLRIAVLYGGTSAEHEVSVVSARSVLAAIDRDKYDVLPIAVTKSGAWLLPERAPHELEERAGSLPGVEEGEGRAVVLRPGGELAGSGAMPGPVDLVFVLLHGPGGEDGTVQGMLETLGMPYVGAGVAASALGMDKSLQKPVFAGAGIPVTPWIAITDAEFARDPQGAVRRARDEIGLPCFTKPAGLGSSVGVSKCKTAEELQRGIEDALRHDGVILVEQAIVGRELECAVLGNDEPEASVVGDILPAHEFYDYEAKYLVEGSDLIIPAQIPEQAAERIRRYAVAAFQAIGCAGMARVDFFLRGEEVFLNEINTIPGFTPISMYPKLWEASGIPYAKLIDRLIELAIERHNVRRR
ncbi:MAG: D-alanine--D-alanine ligase family protein [Actinomycetota bacterium]